MVPEIGCKARQVLVDGLVLDSVKTAAHVLYLARRAPDVVPFAEPFALTYGRRRESPYLLGPAPAELVVSDTIVDGRRYPLVAANVEVSEVIPDVLVEVLIEADLERVVVRARLYGRGLRNGSVREGIHGPHLLVHHQDSGIVRIAFVSGVWGDVPYMVAVAELQGWVPEDVAAVHVGVDEYRDPGNAWLGVPPHTVVPPPLRLR